MAAKAQPAEALVLVCGPLETHSFNVFSLECASSFTEILSNLEGT